MENRHEKRPGSAEGEYRAPGEIRPSSAEGDVHVRIWLSGCAFEYLVAARAVGNLLADWKRQRWCGIEIVPASPRNRRRLPRIPCERLYLSR